MRDFILRGSRITADGDCIEILTNPLSNDSTGGGGKDTRQNNMSNEHEVVVTQTTLPTMTLHCSSLYGKCMRNSYPMECLEVRGPKDTVCKVSMEKCCRKHREALFQGRKC